jgi:hypothetical protein
MGETLTRPKAKSSDLGNLPSGMPSAGQEIYLNLRNPATIGAPMKYNIVVKGVAVRFTATPIGLFG